MKRPWVKAGLLGATALGATTAFLIPAISDVRNLGGIAGGILSQIVQRADSGAVPAPFQAFVQNADYYAWQFGIQTGTDATTAANNCSAFATAFTAINAAGGGKLVLPAGSIGTSCSVDNKFSNIMVTGKGRDGGGTTILAVGSGFSGAVIRQRTPYVSGNQQNKGGGFVDILVDGGGVAPSGLDFDSFSRATEILSLQGTVGTSGYTANFHNCVSNTDITGACDSQHNTIDLNVIQLSTVQTAVGLSGSINANFSGNDKVKLNVVHNNGLALEIPNADNNVIWFGSFRASGGTGNAVLIHGGEASNGNGAYTNVFSRLGAGYANGTAPTIYTNGTDTPGTTSGTVNIIQQLDKANASADPTAGTGSGYVYTPLPAPGQGKSGLYINWGHGTLGAGSFAPVIFSNFGQEGIEVFPGFSSGVNRTLNYNRRSSAYTIALQDAAEHRWAINGSVYGDLSSAYLQLGTAALSQVSAPFNLDLGGTYSTTCGFGGKIKLLGGNGYDLGVCSGTMWFGVPGSSAYSWYRGTTQELLLDPNGFKVGVAENHPIATVSASFTYDATMMNVSVDASGGARTGTLPACTSSTKGRTYRIKKLDASANSVALTASGTDLIDGVTTAATTTQYGVISVQCSNVAGRWDRGF